MRHYVIHNQFFQKCFGSRRVLIAHRLRLNTGQVTVFHPVIVLVGNKCDEAKKFATNIGTDWHSTVANHMYVIQLYGYLLIWFY
jgi:hypothetical protein